MDEFGGAPGQTALVDGRVQGLQGLQRVGVHFYRIFIRGFMVFCHIDGVWAVNISDETQGKNVTMNRNNAITEQFEAHREHLRGVAYRMLASSSEAEDAVQEAYLRLDRADVGEVENLRAWLTTVVARVALDMLRARQSRREEPLELDALDAWASDNPAAETELADSVGLALLVVLERLSPAERLAFVLHDTFGLPFDEIAAIVGRSPAATRQLASRARRRVQGQSELAQPDFARQRAVAQAFLAASRGGDFEALLAVLDPDVVNRVDAVAAPPSGLEIRGARNVARAAASFSARGQFSRLMLIDGKIGIVVAPQGRLMLAMELTFADDKISQMEIVAEPARLARLELAVLAA